MMFRNERKNLTCEVFYGNRSHACVLWKWNTHRILFSILLPVSQYSRSSCQKMVVAEYLIEKLKQIKVVDKDKNDLLVKSYKNATDMLPYGVFKEKFPDANFEDWKMISQDERSIYVKLSRLRILLYNKNLKSSEKDIQGIFLFVLIQSSNKIQLQKKRYFL
jgi:hypothetical protein